MSGRGRRQGREAAQKVVPQDSRELTLLFEELAQAIFELPLLLRSLQRTAKLMARSRPCSPT